MARGADEAFQQFDECGPVCWRECCQDGVLGCFDCGLEAAEGDQAGWCERDGVASPVAGIAFSFHISQGEQRTRRNRYAERGDQAYGE